MEYYDIDFKNDNIENIILSESNENVISLESMVINFFSCEKYIIGILKARETILLQARNGKKGYYTFSYPGLGWVQYDHNSIKMIHKLSFSKTKRYLYDIYNNENISEKIRLHSMAALIIKCSDHFYNLYKGIHTARKFTQDNRIVYINFYNPFDNIILTTHKNKKYTGDEIIKLHNIGISNKSTFLFF